MSNESCLQRLPPLTMWILCATLSGFVLHLSFTQAYAVEVTRQTLFSIPFYINPAAPPPTEVVLYVSGNRGQSWSLYQRRSPVQSKFDFQAGEDGEYWFVVRTNGDHTPPLAQTPAEKIVIVDRARPNLQLSVTPRTTGELTASYQVEDANLDPQSMQLKYRATSDQPWLPVALNRIPSVADATPTELKGQATWVVAESIDRVEVRFEASDRAGNHHEVHWSAVGDEDSPAAASPSGLTRSTSAPQIHPDETDLTTPLPWLPDAKSATTIDQDAGWRSMSDSPRILNGQTDQRSLGNTPGEFNRPFLGAAAGLEPPRPREIPLGSAPVSTSTGKLVAAPPDSHAPPVANRVDVPPPSGQDLQMTNQRQFNLDYDVQGTSVGVSRVELWVTRDGGNSWQPMGLDTDLKSPFLVQLDQEGIYGFRLLIHDERGESARPPQPGDRADLRIGLDWTPPEAHLVDVQYLDSSGQGAVSVKWHADDEFLAEYPIRLSRASDPHGPWSEIAADLPNSGQYIWNSERPISPHTYVRLEVRDRAGNIATVQTPYPIGGVAGPTGVIRGFRPVELQ